MSFVEMPKEVSVQKRAPKIQVPAALKVQAGQCLVRYLNQARTLYNRPFATPTIGFDLSGTTAGKAYLTRNHVQLNAVLYVENAQDFLADTIPHELAHLVAHQVYGRAIKPHGKEWQSVMRSLGVEPSRTHDYDVTNARTVTTYPYLCKCRTHAITKTRLRHARAGKLRCNKCLAILRPTNTLPTPGGPHVAPPARTASVRPCPPPVPPSTNTGRPPTEKMLAYAKSLSIRAGVPLTADALLDFRKCSEAIERLKAMPAISGTAAGLARPGVGFPVGTSASVEPPTEKQLEFANRIAQKKGITIPQTVLGCKRQISEWISKNLNS